MSCVGGIVRPYEGLAFIIAKKFFPYCGAAVDFEDLLQAGAIGAWRAQNTFDETRGSWYRWRHTAFGAVAERLKAPVC